ncbi:MAG: hypothetical protein K8I00_06480, partial [Candidatus Omnitrophica bacterium]|nr:hypothetical protein [Candidatus Omnitrophota bacterium]
AYLYKYYSTYSPKLYLFDLIGAATGCVLGQMIISYVQFNSVPLLLSCLAGILAFAITIRCSEARYSKYIAVLIILLSIFAAQLNYQTGFLEIKRAPNMAVLDYRMQDDVREHWYRWNSYSRLSLISHRKRGSDQTKYLFTIDNGRGNVHLRTWSPDGPVTADLLEGFSPVGLAFLANAPQDILIMFAGAGIDMLQAYYLSDGKADITGVELNPLIVNSAPKLPRFRLGEFFALDNVHMHIREGRDFLNATEKKYDAIIYSWGGASFSNYLGTSGYTGRFLFTKEAMTSVIDHLTPDGVIGIVNSNKIRVIATMKTAFEESGRRDFGDHVVILERSTVGQPSVYHHSIFSTLDNHVVLYKNSPFTEEDLDRIDRNASDINLTVLYSPRYVRPEFQAYKDTLLAKDTHRYLQDLSRKYLIDLSVSVDDRPFIENMFYPQMIFTKDFWTNIDSFSRRDSTKQHTLNIYTFWFIVFLVLLAFLLILLPLLLTQRLSALKADLPYLYYFSTLGVGFILIEIALMNQFVLFLGNPIFAFSLILAVLLLSTGIGSYISKGLFEKGIVNIGRMALVCAGLLLVYFFLLPVVLRSLLGVTQWLK